jgi:NarL family two-component system response regulator YdfI
MKMKILIADADKEVRNNILETLRLNLKEGRRIQFIEKSSGKLTLVELILEKPDIALIDINLPEIGALEILSTLKYLGKSELISIPVIVMTLRTEKKILMEMLKLGARDFLVKPIDIESLIKKVENLMSGNNIPNENEQS